MLIRLYTRGLLSLSLLVVVACGQDEPYDELGIRRCTEHGDIMCGDIYTEDLLIPHNSAYRKVMGMATVEALRDYLLSKKNLNRASPFRIIADGKGDMQDLLRGLTLVKRGYSINPIFALALSALESSWGMSSIARKKYNLWGFNAADRQEHRASAFESFTHGFERVFRYIKFQYLRREGKFHKRCSPPQHFRRYVRRGGCSARHCGESLAGMNCKYSSDPDWAKKIRMQMNHIAAFIKMRCRAMETLQPGFPHIDGYVSPNPPFPPPHPYFSRPLLSVAVTHACDL